MKTFDEWHDTAVFEKKPVSIYELMLMAWNASAENSAEEIAKRDERIAELEQDLQTTADALGHAHQDIERLKRESSACDLLEEQKGTIKALNWALGGEDSTSTENLIDAHEVDYAEEGLIALCRKLTQENVRLEDVVLFQKKAWTADFEELERLRDQLASQESSPITEEGEDILRSKNQNLFNALMESTKRTDEQAAEISRLKGVIAKCEETLQFMWRDVPMNDYAFNVLEESIAAIKEEGL